MGNSETTRSPFFFFFFLFLYISLFGGPGLQNCLAKLVCSSMYFKVLKLALTLFQVISRLYPPCSFIIIMSAKYKG